jgi:hypothetical protein
VKGDDKSAQLKNIVSSLQAELVLGTESWLNDQVNSAEVHPEGYTVFRRDRQRGSGGGVLILVSSKFDSSEPKELQVPTETDCEVIWVKVKIKETKTHESMRRDYTVHDHSDIYNS